MILGSGCRGHWYGGSIGIGGGWYAPACSTEVLARLRLSMEERVHP